MLAALLKNISDESKKILFIGFTVSIGITLPILIACITIVFMNSKEVSVKTDSLEFELSGQAKQLKAVDDNSSQKFQEEFNNLKKDFNDLKEQAKKKKVLKVLSPEIEKVDSRVEQAEIRLGDVNQSSAQLKEFVEDAIATP